MFNNIFCEMKGKKVIHQGGQGGNGGTVQISSWKCNFNRYLDIQVYYLDIQAITTLLWLYWFFMYCFLLFIQIVCYNHSPEKWRVPALKSLRLPEFRTYKDGTGFILKRNEVSIQKSHTRPIHLAFFLLIPKVYFFFNYAMFQNFCKFYFGR